MAKVGAQRAAELTGRSKSTIQRAMKTGKLSYEVDNAGRRVIDVAELDRAFGLMPQGNDRAEDASVEAELEKATQMLELERLKMRIKMLEEQLDTANTMIDDLKEQRDLWQKQAQQVLLTSQYSQKQAEDLKQELKDRERRARARRQQEMERRGQRVQTTNENRQPGPIEKARLEAKAFDIQGLWTRFRGTAAAAAEPATSEPAAETEEQKQASA